MFAFKCLVLSQQTWLENVLTSHEDISGFIGTNSIDVLTSC